MSNPLQEHPEATLIAAINAQLGSTLAVGEFLFTPPQRLEDHPSERNTMIVVVPYVTSGFYGRVKVYYNRTHLSALGAIEVERANETTIRQLVPRINAHKGIFLKVDNVVDAVLPPKTGNDGKIAVVLQMLATDLVFYGQGVLPSVGPAVMPVVWPEEGTQIDSGCHGYALVGSLADGYGGYTEVVLDAESPFCGFVGDPGTTQFIFQDPPNDSGDLVFDEPTS